MSEEKQHTATGRMFDENGVLAAAEGDRVPDSVWKGLTAEKDYAADEFHQLSAQQAADASKKRAPARESR